MSIKSVIRTIAASAALLSFGQAFAAPPVVTLDPQGYITVSDSDGRFGETITVTFTATATDPDGDAIVSYEWGNPNSMGIPEAGGSSQIFTINLQEVDATGVYVKVTDSRGEVAYSDMVSYQAAPRVTATIANHAIRSADRQSVTFNVTSSGPAAGEVASYMWFLGHPMTTSSPSLTLSGADLEEVETMSMIGIAIFDAEGNRIAVAEQSYTMIDAPPEGTENPPPPSTAGRYIIRIPYPTR